MRSVALGVTALALAALLVFLRSSRSPAEASIGYITVSPPMLQDALNRQFTITLDGGGSVLATGAKDIGLRVPYNMTLTGWELKSYPTASTASLTVDVWVDDFASHPPTNDDTITGGNEPALASAIIASGTCSGWTTALTAGDSLEVNVDSVAVSTRVVLSLYGTVR